MQEIAAWGGSSDAAKRAVWQALPERQRSAAFPEALHNASLMQFCRQQKT